jgi:hypothetical protein
VNLEEFLIPRLEVQASSDRLFQEDRLERSGVGALQFGHILLYQKFVWELI